VSRFNEAFGGVPRVFLPVVHPVSVEAVYENVLMAIDAGAHGVFLINQGMSADSVLRLAAEIRGRHSIWVGVNILGSDPMDVVDAAARDGLDGVWSDNHLRHISDQEYQGAPLYFGGTAFKYQKPMGAADLPRAARCAMGVMDVVTTSGPGTGMAAPVEKVRVMREALGKFPLAIASGITPDNVDGFLPYVDAYLVATGIEREFGWLDAKKTKALADRIRNYKDGNKEGRE